MKSLVILRHAKSSWASPGAGDRERDLAHRGIQQMALMAAWYRDNLRHPQHVLCSPATRTRHTLLRLSLPEGTDVAYPGSLYLGDLDDYLAHLWACEADTVLVVGHNPTCDELVRFLAVPQGSAYQGLMNHHFGTANLAAFDLPIDNWAELGKASGNLTHFVRPRDLEGA